MNTIDKFIIKLVLGLILSTSLVAFADDGLLQDFESLGGNDVLLDKAQALRPETRVEIVQKRVVDRFHRNEFYPEFEVATGGNSYVNSNGASMAFQHHINPHWSVGAKYSYFFNKLTPEGDRVVREAKEAVARGEAEQSRVPEINWAKQSYVAILNWYPIYGKLNVFNKGIVHFDIYALAGAGKIDLRKSSSNTYLTGLGVGFWISQHMTSRIEYKYQKYNVEGFVDKKDVGVNSFSLSLGYLL